MIKLPSSRRLLFAASLLLGFAAVVVACPESPVTQDTRGRLPDGGYACEYVGPYVRACCNGNAGCGDTLWCNTSSCQCEDIEEPCGGSSDGGVIVVGPSPDAGSVPTGTVGLDGGTVDRLWFATTGDTRPGNCDETDLYPRAAINQIAASMKALRVQFALDLGDHMYVCNDSVPEAQQQMGFYTSAQALGPSTWFMTMGNHECGHSALGSAGAYGCFAGKSDANFNAYMTALNRPTPWYSFDVKTGPELALARFVVVADDSWDNAQASWLESTLADADVHAKYTIVARHHPMNGSRAGNANLIATIEKHKYSLLLTAHTHSYAHGTDHGGRAAIIGLGGAPTSTPPGFGTVMQNAAGSLTFTLRDVNGNPLGSPWVVNPQ